MKRSAYPIKTMSVTALLLLCSSAFLGAFDFGLAAEQEFSAQRNIDNAVIDYAYTAGLVPYFSVPLGNSGDLYISAKVSGVYEREEWFFVPEILHTEFSLRFDNLKIRIGRMPYADPLNFIVEGLFDGVQVLCDTSIGSFNAGAWYTGLLYKKSASIMMTQEDYISYYAPVDYNNFSDTYFASRRLLAAAGWEHPSLAQLIRVRTALTGQFDYNDAGKPYHSAYFSGKAVMPLKRFVFNAGFGICMDTGEIELGCAWETGISWLPPTPLFSQLSLNWRSGYGKFVPITVKDQGEILQAALSGVFLDFTARLSQSFTFGLAASLFLRSDLDANRGYSVYKVLSKADDGNSITGSEFFGRLIWSPFSDVTLNLGGGVFTPGISFTEFAWRAELGLVIFLY